MAHVATDGKKFGAPVPMKAHNRSLERSSNKSQAGGAGTGQGMTDPLKNPGMEGGGMEQGGEDPHQVMQEHGPAMETHTVHPPEGQEGPHMAHSMHPDGHEHHSQHGSGKEAHEHAACLSGHCDHGNMEDGGQHEQEPEAEFE